MSSLDQLAERFPLPSWRGIAWLVVVLIAAFLVWARFAELDEVTVISGQVIPAGQVRTIQHLEGGLIEQIRVAEGDAVEKGQELVHLSLAATSLNLDEIQVLKDGLLLRRARLKTEAFGGELAFPEAEAERLADVAFTERKIYEERRSERDTRRKALQAKARQSELQIEELRTQISATGVNLGLARQRFALADDLLKSGLIPKLEHLSLSSDVKKLEGELAILEKAMPRARAALHEIRQSIKEDGFKFTRQAREELAELEIRIARADKQLSEAESQNRRTIIRSPIDGVVKNLQHHTIGGVVRAGDPIMEIVPLREKLVVEGQLPPADRGYVELGQKAIVKVSAYDFTRYGGLDGKVVSIAADTSVNRQGEAHYRIVVETEKGHIGDESEALAISPGMEAMVDIHSGKRTVFEYLITPVLKLKHEAFRER